LYTFKELLTEDIDKDNIIKNMEKSISDKSSKMVKINVKIFDKVWRGDKDYYIGKGGTLNSIGDRYENFLKILNMPKEKRDRWLTDSKDGNVIAPSVSVYDDGSVSFGNGRHRFAVLRDLHIKQIPVTMMKDSIQNAKKYKYI